jgi:hypothetical protein
MRTFVFVGGGAIEKALFKPSAVAILRSMTKAAHITVLTGALSRPSLAALLLLSRL